MRRNYSPFLLLAIMLSACGANRPLPTVAVLPSDTPRSSAAPAITVVATLAVDSGKPTLKSPPTAIATVTLIFTLSPSPTVVIASPTAPTLPTTENAEPDKREVTTCPRILELFSSIQSDKKGEFPADFPKPPDGSVVCGTDGPGSVHYSNTLNANAVAAYYREKLQAWGCEIAQDKVFKPNWITLRFECPKGMVHVATDPDITEFIVRFVANK